MDTEMSSRRPSRAGRVVDVLAVFLWLGVTSFAGPIAHLGYFRREFVERRRWLDDEAFTDFVALCQFLPGPASSQTGFSIGLPRAGWAGGLAAWCGFTLPSVFVMLAFAAIAPDLGGPVGTGLVHGLKLVAVTVVGLLAAALYSPVWTSAIRTQTDFAIACIGFFLLTRWRVPPFWVVIFCAARRRRTECPSSPGETTGHGCVLSYSHVGDAVIVNVQFSPLSITPCNN
jgi:chromate transport protein ChrA